MPKRIYVAGKYSADNVIEVLKNIGTGKIACANLFRLGYHPFCPWSDMDYIIHNPDGEFTVQQFYDLSIAWLEVSDAMLLLPGWEKSIGTNEEVKIAGKLGIPFFNSIEALDEYFKRED